MIGFNSGPLESTAAARWYVDELWGNGVLSFEVPDQVWLQDKDQLAQVYLSAVRTAPHTMSTDCKADSPSPPNCVLAASQSSQPRYVAASARVHTPQTGERRQVAIAP
eukprot:1159344-Pelagomonas_calceolata.AAC.17